MIAAIERNGRISIPEWIGQAQLLSPDGETAIPLSLAGTRLLAPEEVPAKISGFAALKLAEHLIYIEIRLQLPLSPRRNLPSLSGVFDLWAGDRCLRRRSVAFTQIEGQKLRLAFACDFHLADLWNEINEAIKTYSPELSARALNPALQWKRFVNDVNSLWDRSDLDLVVLGGDLVDHVLVESAEDASADSNVHRFLDALLEIRAPVFVIPGNHDFRLNSWRPRVYGLGALGLTKSETRELLRLSPLGKGGIASPGDLRSLETHDRQGESALARHLSLLAPSGDYSVDVAGMRLIFASTGCDAVAKWREVARRNPVKFLRSLASSWRIPDSLGFDEQQIVRISELLSGASGAAIFFHAPLLNPPTTTAGSAGFSTATKGSPWEMPPFQGMETKWQRAGLRKGVSFLHASALLEQLIRSGLPVTTFSGHIHRATRLDLAVSERRLYQRPVSSTINEGRTIQLLTAPSVGQTDPGGLSDPGYLLACFDHGRLKGIELRSLSDK